MISQIQTEFIEFMLENEIVSVADQPFTLKSGKQSHLYVNWRKATNDAYLLDFVSDKVLEFTAAQGIEADCFYGVPEGASKLGVIASYKYAKQSPEFGKGSHTISFGRGKPKEHGAAQDRFFIGAPEGRTVVLEDVVTTSGSLVSNLDSLKEAGINVVASICLTNRNPEPQSVKSLIEVHGAPFLALVEAEALIEAYLERNTVSESVLAGLHNEFPFLLKSAA